MSNEVRRTPVLSICIPSYNHGREQFEKIQCILNASEDVEVVCSDNASTDETKTLLPSIKSSRFLYQRSNVNLGPTVNYIRALSMAHGKYAMFVTDKDMVDTRHLEWLVELFRTCDFSMGYIALDSKTETPAVRRYRGKYNSLCKFSYLSKHPSGYFFNTALMRRLDMERYSDMDVVGVFPFEFIAADLALYGNCALIDVPLIRTAPIYKSDGSISCSGTYSSRNGNLFFAPDMRFAQYERYVAHLSALRIGCIAKLALFVRLTRRTVSFMTKSFKSLLGNRDLMQYYKVDVLDYSYEKIKADIHARVMKSVVITGLYRIIFSYMVEKKMEVFL